MQRIVKSCTVHRHKLSMEENLSRASKVYPFCNKSNKNEIVNIELIPYNKSSQSANTDQLTRPTVRCKADTYIQANEAPHVKGKCVCKCTFYLKPAYV